METSTKKKYTLPCILAFVGLSLIVCVVLVVGAGGLYWLNQSGELDFLSGYFSDVKLPTVAENNTSSNYDGAPIQPISAGDEIVISADGARLTIPDSALESEIGATLKTFSPDAELEQIMLESFQTSAVLYQITADGENDGLGQAKISVPTEGGYATLMEIIDGEYISLTELDATDGNINFQVPIGSASMDEGDESLQFNGNYLFAIFQDPIAATLDMNDNLYMVAANHQNDTRNCGIPFGSGSPLNYFCRQNSKGTIIAIVNEAFTTKITQDKADQIVDLIEKILGDYGNKGFLAAQLVNKSESRVHVQILKGSGDPYYSPSNSTIYIPEDSAAEINEKLSWELAHELAHWVQDYSYNFTRAYWGNLIGTSPYRQWWLEVSAENMVFLFDPAAVENNLTYYGMTTVSTHNTPFQYSPNLWNDQLYNHAQLVKVFMCENTTVCPISESGFIEAINQGTFPYEGDVAVNQISENLQEYARYLLGKSPISANATIPIMEAVINGRGYGESIEAAFKSGIGELKKTGYDPQMVTAGDPGSQIININAEIQAGGVYPLVVQTGINPKLEKIPLQVKVLAGAPFYYRVGDGDIQYSDGTKDMMLGLVHPVWGVKNIRLVAIAIEGEATFKAEIRNIDFRGTWSISIIKDTTIKDISCDESNKVWVAEYAASSMPALVLRMGDFNPNSSFSDLVWQANQTRWDSYIAGQDPTISTLDVMSGEGLSLIAPEEIMLKMAYTENEAQPYQFSKDEGDAIIWDQVTGTYILNSTFTKLEYLNPQGPGEPLWKLSDGRVSIDINAIIVSMQFGPSGDLDYPKDSYPCSGTLSYDAHVFITPNP